MNNESTNKIICRKCGGPHFTIKCGKDKPIIVEQVKQDELVEQVKKDESYQPKFEHKFNNNKRERHHSKKIFRVKLSELPRDMYEEELMELTSEWGHIVKIKVINYNENSVAYIDFGFEDESIYFIEAIHKTPFDSLLLSATSVESY
jgi:hypothetical protein